MSKRVGGITYEGRYFITSVPDEWTAGQPLPDPAPDDLWFDRLADFVAAMAGPWSHERVNRQPWTGAAKAVPSEPPEVHKISFRRTE
jgi:hypothetical protein